MLVAGLVTGALSQTTFVVDSAFSPSLERIVRYAILLPSGYQPAERYPVLYLLHGLNGDCQVWNTKLKLGVHAAPYRVIIVMPDAGSSWYVNARMAESERFEDFVVQDLPRIVGLKYNIDTVRTAIAGYSMGGYGALMLSLRHPGRYRFAGSLSGAINFPREAESFRATANQSSKESFIRAFGSEPGEFYDRHDILLLAMKIKGGATPYLYFSTGVQDGYRSFLPAHRILTDSLRAHAMAYEYHELPGKHNWAFWDQEIQPMLKRMQEVFATVTKGHEVR